MFGNGTWSGSTEITTSYRWPCAASQALWLPCFVRARNRPTGRFHFLMR